MEHGHLVNYYSDTQPRFLESAVNKISSFFSQTWTSKEKDEEKDESSKEVEVKEVLNKSDFRPVEGSKKAFPPFKQDRKGYESMFSQPDDSVASTSVWTPHLLPPGKERVGVQEKEITQGNFSEKQLTRFKELLMRQKRIKQGFLRSLQLAKGRGASINPILEEGRLPEEVTDNDKNDTTEAALIVKPFLGDFDIDGDELRAQQRERRKGQKPVKFSGPIPSELRDHDDDEGMAKSENIHVPIFATTAHTPHGGHDSQIVQVTRVLQY